MTSDPQTESRTGSTLLDLFGDAAARHRGKTFHFPSIGKVLTYAEVFRNASAIAEGLGRRGIGRGHIVGLLAPTGPEFLEGLFGILSAGAAVAPLAPPPGLRQLDRYRADIRRIHQDTQLRAILTCPDLKGNFDGIDGIDGIDGPRILTAADLPLASNTQPKSARREPVQPHDLALVQYTSGSTSAPKGVALTHHNVVSALLAIIDGIKLSSADVNGQWLPLYHDMGLIGMLAGVAAGVEHHLWPPSAFVRAPDRWLADFAACGATIYTGPSFSYAKMLSRCQRSGTTIDLSGLRVAFNGAEPIDGDTLRAFCDYFAPGGFRPEAMFPVYGLAEATLAATFPSLGAVPTIGWFDRKSLAEGRTVQPAVRGTPEACGLVALGQAVRSVEMRVTTVQDHPVQDGVVGQVELRGAPIMRGYIHKNPAESGISPDGWLRTGDLGFVHGGDLFVCGRRKEVIVLHGKNIYPRDVEGSVEQLSGVYDRRCVALSITNADREGLAVLVETRLRDRTDRQRLVAEVTSRVRSDFGITDPVVYLVEPRELETTSSGKFRRLSIRARFLAGEFRAAG